MRAAGQLSRTAVNRVRRRQVSVGEEFLQGSLIERSIEPRMLRQRRELGAEEEQARVRGIIERLLAEPVTGREQALPRPVPQDEREHAVQSDRQAVAPFFITMDEDLGVGMVAPEAVPAPLQLRSELGLVLNISVEDI